MFTLPIGLLVFSWATTTVPAHAPQVEGDSPSLRLRAEHRSRFEHLASDYRAGGGDVTALSLRTVLAGEWGSASSFARIEIIDARSYAGNGAPLNTTHVDVLDLLTATLVVGRSDVLRTGDRLALRAGRFTKDFGGRRLIARNAFRNTINAFGGVELAWNGAGGSRLEAFAVLPVTRLPRDVGDLEHHRREFDRENTDAVLWGVSLGVPLEDLAGSSSTSAQAYLVGFHERDGATTPSSDRRLFTPGVRVVRPPRLASLDFDIEAMAQLGTSRATVLASDERDLSHLAYSAHVSAGYRVDTWAAPRIVLQYDLASGDADAADARNGRFDPLFGARAFELGPTGYYGALARSNLSSLGVRLEAAPRGGVELVAVYRLAWLASKWDAWTTTGLRDVTGAAGGFLGQQAEARLRVRPGGVPFVVESGAAALVRGRFARETSGTGGAALYLFTQLTLSGGRP